MTPARAAHSERSAARFYAVQALFQMEAGGQTVESVRREFEDWRIGAIVDGEEMVEADIPLFRRLIDDAVNWQARIDKLTDHALMKAWPLARIDPTLRALFRAAGAELMHQSTPPRVVINEFVEIAKAFFPEGRESQLVNAVLDHMAHDAKPDAF